MIQLVEKLELVLAVREHFEREHDPLVAAFRWPEAASATSVCEPPLVLDVVLEQIALRAQSDKPELLQRLLQIVLTDEAEGAVRLAAVVDVDRVGADAHEAGKVAADRRRSRPVAERAAGERAVVIAVVRAGAVREMRLDVVFVDDLAFTRVGFTIGVSSMTPTSSVLVGKVNRTPKLFVPPTAIERSMKIVSSREPNRL